MDIPAQRLASRYLARVARSFNPEHEGLEGLLRGERTVLYHGTTAMFTRFDPNQSRTDLVDRFYGAGIFLTPSKRVAVKYALANRNMGFPPSLIDDLRTKNPNAASFLEALYVHGQEAWDMMMSPEALGVEPGADVLGAMQRFFGGLDPNTIDDVSEWIIGTKRDPVRSLGDGSLSLLSQSTGMPSWAYDQLDELGLDSKKYRPKVYTVAVQVENVLVTSRKAEARNARRKGYDAVVFHGADLVDDHAEVAVFDPHKVKILGVEEIE